ncbi:MAG: cyclic nucleotide-binding domain-containing protein [Nitrospirae bacterium]|nr:cyclic nucleotide-binding domain-containing protein [Nitrospirota bacterium]
MNNLWENIFKRKDKEGIRDILKKIPVFEGLGGNDISHIERILHRREYKEGEVIFTQGTPGFGMYIIEDGSVTIAAEPSMEVLAELQSGDFFGELALLDDSPRSATAVAKTPCRMLCFFQPDMFDLIEQKPQMGVKILLCLARTIGERLKRTNAELHALQEKSAKQD